MNPEKKSDTWSTEEYQNSASFVPKLATKVVSWLDVQPDDVILDIGCGDGILNAQFAEILKKGSGKQLGLDSSEKMIQASKSRCAGSESTFEAHDCSKLVIPEGFRPTKIFSNAALHWILNSQNSQTFFNTLTGASDPGTLLIFEMGGLGNIAEMRTAIIMAITRRLGAEKARMVDPWFFPDEEWARKCLADGWVIEECEREMRTTKADEGGVEGWVRLMGRVLFEAVPETDREECIQEAVQVLDWICQKPGSEERVMGYVRLRVKARRI